MTYETRESQVVPQAGQPSGSRGRLRSNKVPEVTVYFWIIKVLCTTVGETAADLLNEKAGLGLTGVSVLMSALLGVVLVVQFRSSAYRPGVYWSAVAGWWAWEEADAKNTPHTKRAVRAGGRASCCLCG
ncbi:hypothetical protein ACFXDI_48195, partial [Streptomyces mirabilis]